MSKYEEMDNLLTVEEAGRLIHVGRCMAYEMASMYESNPATGIPTVSIGRKKFVPKWELLKRFRMIPDTDLIKMLVQEVGKERMIELIEKEG
jgi:hypothetical protein